jgi:hypothetical protein
MFGLFICSGCSPASPEAYQPSNQSYESSSLEQDTDHVDSEASTDQEKFETRVEYVLEPQYIQPLVDVQLPEGITHRIQLSQFDDLDSLDPAIIDTLRMALLAMIEQDKTKYHELLSEDAQISSLNGDRFFSKEYQDRKIHFYAINSIEKVFKSEINFYYRVNVVSMESTSNEDFHQNSYDFIFTRDKGKWFLHMVD